MARIFTYIVHRRGAADDSAFELAAAARKIDAAASPTAILTGWGGDLDAACDAIRASYAETWKIANEALAYPNAELVRKALHKVLPSNSIVLVAHDHFGIDLAPGLSIKTNSAFVSDVLDIVGLEGADLKVVRQEFGGQVSAHVRCDVSSGAVVTIRPGAFKPASSSTDPTTSALWYRAGAIWRRSSPRRVMSISPSTTFWFPSAVASRKKTMWPWRRNWLTPWVRR
jgi:electron transfer flavoprotein alpha subunit